MFAHLATPSEVHPFIVLVASAQRIAFCRCTMNQSVQPFPRPPDLPVSQPSETSPASESPRPERSGRARRWGFRFFAILLGLAALPLAELVCWLGGWGEPSKFDDPFMGFSQVLPLFEKNADGSKFRIAPSRYRFFAPDSFPVQKPAGTRRVFCLGGSTVQGRPYTPETSFTTFLELGLNAAERNADRDQSWEVVNCGGISYASYRLLPIMQECLAYEPDLFILCTGHNEFLEDRTYAHLKDPSAPLWASQHLAGRLRTFVLLRELKLRLAGQNDAPTEADRPQLGPETDPILDYHDSLKAYHRDLAWRDAIVAHFEFNLRRMVDLARQHRIPLVMVLPASNLGDTPPLKSEHRAGLGEAELAAWEDLVASAQRSYRSSPQQALKLLQQAKAIDSEHAGLWYEIGKCYLLFGLHEQARAAFVNARDNDICPLRMISPLEEAMLRVAAEQNVPLLDAHHLLEAECEDGILDDTMLIDHVHPTIEGHQLIATALIELLAEHRFLTLTDGWQDQAEKEYAANVAGLDELYFLRGQKTLNSVRGWMQGSADGPPAAARFPHLLNNEKAPESPAPNQ